MNSTRSLSSQKNKRVFAFTSSDQQKSSLTPRKKKAIIRSEANCFITTTISKFSVKNSVEYLNTTRPTIISSHIKRETERIKNENNSIQVSDIFLFHQELNIHLNVLANEIVRLEKENSQLLSESSNLNKKVADFYLKQNSSHPMLGLREASCNQEDIDRLKSFIQTQKAALNLRKERELFQEASPSYQSILEAETAKIREKTNEIRTKIRTKMKKDKEAFFQLTLVKSDAIEALDQYFNTTNQDISVSMKDVIEYVKTEDPIVQYRDFLRESIEDDY